MDAVGKLWFYVKIACNFVPRHAGAVSTPALAAVVVICLVILFFPRRQVASSTKTNSSTIGLVTSGIAVLAAALLFQRMVEEKATHDALAELKQSLRPADIDAAWAKISAAMEDRHRIIRQQGNTLIPILSYDQVSHRVAILRTRRQQQQRQQPVDKDDKEEREWQAIESRIREIGTVVITAVVEPPAIDALREDFLEYLRANPHYRGYPIVGRPQILEIYHSKAQVRARQDERVAVTRQFLNQLWKYQDADPADGGQSVSAAAAAAASVAYFDPFRDIAYLDRARISSSESVLSLGAHIDGGSLERFTDAEYRRLLQPLWRGDYEQLDLFDGRHRVGVMEAEDNPNTSTVFRTFQGWLALTDQGGDDSGDGTLRVVPFVKESLAYVLMRSFLRDVDDAVFLGAAENQAAQSVLAGYHQLVVDSLVTIPRVSAGSMVFWSPDVTHAVSAHANTTSNPMVFYIASTPMCEKNYRYIVDRQRERFVQGRSPPDYPQLDEEVGYVDRATEEQLSELGRKQLGLQRWDDADSIDDVDFASAPVRKLRQLYNRIFDRRRK